MRILSAQHTFCSFTLYQSGWTLALSFAPLGSGTTHKYISRTMPQTLLNMASQSMEDQPSQAGSSLHGEMHSSGFPRPPITPYDVLFLVTTIIFGIAKAVTTSCGTTVAPTTLEWVGSVIVFLLQVLFSQPNFMHLTYLGFM